MRKSVYIINIIVCMNMCFSLMKRFKNREQVSGSMNVEKDF